MGNGQNIPVFMSAHPGDEERVRKIRGVMPEAL